MTRNDDDEDLSRFTAVLNSLSNTGLRQVLAAANVLAGARNEGRRPTREDIIREHEALGVPLPDFAFETLLGETAP